MRRKDLWLIPFLVFFLWVVWSASNVHAQDTPEQISVSDTLKAPNGGNDGAYELGTDLALIAKPGTDMDNWLRLHQNERVVIVVTTGY